MTRVHQRRIAVFNIGSSLRPSRISVLSSTFLFVTSISSTNFVGCPHIPAFCCYLSIFFFSRVSLHWKQKWDSLLVQNFRGESLRVGGDIVWLRRAQTRILYLALLDSP